MTSHDPSTRTRPASSGPRDRRKSTSIESSRVTRSIDRVGIDRLESSRSRSIESGVGTDRSMRVETGAGKKPKPTGVGKKTQRVTTLETTPPHHHPPPTATRHRIDGGVRDDVDVGSIARVRLS